MNWYVAVCLLIAALCIPAFILIVRAIVREIRKPRKAAQTPSNYEEPLQTALPEVDDRTAALMFRQSFVATMMERYQEMGAPGDVIDFINGELVARSANWRVRELPDGRGEFYDLDNEKPRRWRLGARVSSAA